ncbi:alpha/beta hydrolase [Mesorhizobium sp.]|uniref:RBBP9/YdeN family alpha/beta hydrolase n=1 Tax=Mesorhizobium sp. TaxID=1871066 RepID=UPI000FE5EADB|nr:alpha/beta hydrolase [Mesorhizobium sp.]RWF63539.1 MAG: serine hydrolase family protein [Mesorhizobium sp.]
MNEFIIVPGIGGSGEAHWQTRWQRANPAMRRFSPASWEQPDLDDWIGALDAAVAAANAPPVLISHSLGCLLVAHWQLVSKDACAGAFLVAVPDPASQAFPASVRGFAGAPAGRLRFPSLSVASSDDPYGSLDHAETKAAQWGSGLHVAGALGHINGDSGLGDWAEGMKLLAAFASEAGRTALLDAGTD